MESGVHTTSVAGSTPESRLKAAHLAICRHLAGMAARSPAATAFQIETSANLYFDDDGRRTSVSLFDLHTLVDGLMSTRQAFQAHKSSAGVTLHLTPSGMHGLKVFAETVSHPARAAEVRSRPHAKLVTRQSLDERKLAARESGQEFVRRYGEDTAFTTANSVPVSAPRASPSVAFSDKTKSGRFVFPIMRSLGSGSKTSEMVLQNLCRMTGAAYGDVDAAFDGGPLSLRNMANNCLRFLIARGFVASSGRALGLTLEGREQVKSGRSPVDDTFQDPDMSADVVRQDLPVRTRVGMTEAQMQAMLESLETKTPFQVLVMWKNALRIAADPDRAGEHLQANVLIRGVQSRWNRQSESGEVAEMFRWPEIEGRAAARRGGDEADYGHFEGLERVGMLAYLGYKVGSEGLSAPVRRKLLSEVFTRSLPPAFHREYMEQWGEPGTAARLRKIADCIASFARNASRKDADFSQAIREWDDDLAYLHDRHYRGTFGFSWPADDRAGRPEHHSAAMR